MACNGIALPCHFIPCVCKYLTKVQTFELEGYKILEIIFGTRQSINNILVSADQINSPFVFGIWPLNFSAPGM
jgi:hypothetical protein